LQSFIVLTLADEIKMQKLSGDQLGAFVQVSPIAFYQAGMQPADLRRWFEEVKLFIMLQPLSFKRSQLNALQEQITRAKKSFVVSTTILSLSNINIMNRIHLTCKS
jgi:hypothetical protein